MKVLSAQRVLADLADKISSGAPAQLLKKLNVWRRKGLVALPEELLFFGECQVFRTLDGTKDVWFVFELTKLSVAKQSRSMGIYRTHSATVVVTLYSLEDNKRTKVDVLTETGVSALNASDKAVDAAQHYVDAYMKQMYRDSGREPMRDAEEFEYDR